MVAVDAPLTLPSCVRCALPACPGIDACDVPTIGWFRERENGARVAGKKPKYTPYTQRASEVLLHEEHKILPRETLGQGMGPLTARAAYLTRALASTHRLNENLIEVYPKATLTQLFAARTRRALQAIGRLAADAARDPERARRICASRPARGGEHGLANDHKFDAVICAYTAYLWSRGACLPPPDAVVRDDGWISVPAEDSRATARFSHSKRGGDEGAGQRRR